MCRGEAVEELMEEGERCVRGSVGRGREVCAGGDGGGDGRGGRSV